jgi:hypothetical protein
MNTDIDSIDMTSITKKKWEKFRTLFDREYEHRIERLGITVKFSGLTLGAIEAIDNEPTPIQKAFKAIEFAVTEPLGSELTKLKEELTLKEAMELYIEIRKTARASITEEERQELLQFVELHALTLAISKETHWHKELLEMSYEDVLQLVKILKDKSKMLTYLSEKYKVEHPKVKDKKFWDEMEIMMGDPVAAIERVKKHTKDSQLKDKDGDGNE